MKRSFFAVALIGGVLVYSSQAFAQTTNGFTFSENMKNLRDKMEKSAIKENIKATISPMKEKFEEMKKQKEEMKQEIKEIKQTYQEFINTNKTAWLELNTSQKERLKAAIDAGASQDEIKALLQTFKTERENMRATITQTMPTINPTLKQKAQDARRLMESKKKVAATTPDAKPTPQKATSERIRTLWQSLFGRK